MVTTVTTATVTMVNSMTSFGVSLGLIAVCALLCLMVQRELMTAAGGQRAVVFGRVLNVAIVPLLLAFAFIVVVKVVSALS